MKIHTDRNIAFKVSNEKEFEYLKKLLNNDFKFHFKSIDFNYFGNKPIWIYKQTSYDTYGYDLLNKITNPKLHYPTLNYIIIEIKHLMRTEKLKRIQ